MLKKLIFLMNLILKIFIQFQNSFQKKNEKTIINNKKLEISNKPFVLKQKIFVGKGLDIVIVQLYENNQADFFCFQIIKYKKKGSIYSFQTQRKFE